MMYYTNRYSGIAIFTVFAVHSGLWMHHNAVLSYIWAGTGGGWAVVGFIAFRKWNVIFSFSHTWLVCQNQPSGLQKMEQTYP